MNPSDLALEYVSKNKAELCNKFVDLQTYPPALTPITFFMAGAPGAGKTEWSLGFLKGLKEEEPARRIARIDPDEIRAVLPGYDPQQAHIFQNATYKAVNKIVAYAIEHNQDFLLDGTFSNLTLSTQNIKRCFQRKRNIAIFYIYQDPLDAWDITKKREAIIKRVIKKDTFISAFFKSKENVNAIKAEYGKNVELNLVIQDIKNNSRKQYFNIDKVDPYIKKAYNVQTLEEILL